MTAPAPYDLSIDSGGDGFPVSASTPRLSWRLPAGWSSGDEFELEARIDDSRQATVEVQGHRLIEWPWRPLRSTERVQWRVIGRAEPVAGWSPWHAFEAGLFDDDWSARWISPVEQEGLVPATRPAYRLRGTFTAEGTVTRARVYATALGVYEAFVNEVRAGTAELSPGATSYDRTVYAQASDVRSAIRQGENTVDMVLSDGWYRGQVGAFREPAGWGSVLGARLELHLDYADGTNQVVRTDVTWTSSVGPITRADLMDGQTTDLTAAYDSERPVLVDAVEAPPVGWSPAPPVRRVAELPAVSLTRSPGGAWIADFGQNASGWLRLADLGPAGTRTVIDYGEHLDPHGDLTLTHLDGFNPQRPRVPFRQRDEVVSSGGDQVFEPRHTVHGFRYARIDRGDVPLDPASLSMQVVHTDFAPAGAFESSNDDLNRLHEVARWSFLGNAVDVPTDCPTRERLGWTGDYQVFAPTAARLYDISGFSRKWLQSVRDDQLPDGRIANFSPDGRRSKVDLASQTAMMTGSAGWGDAIVAVPWLLYETYGDTRALAENWDAMVRWVEWAAGIARSARHPSRVEQSAEPAPHEQYLWDGSFHWGEWLEPKQRADDGSLIDPVQSNPMAWFMADKGEVATAYLYRSTSTLAEIARVLGRPDDATRYLELAAHVREAWRTEYLDDHGRTTSDTQAGYVRALSFGLIPDDLRPASAARLVELIRAAGMHLGTGFLSTADLLPVLADHGYADVAYDVLLQRTSPSWLGMLDRGATTIWEDWDGVDADGTAHESLNHYSKGAVIRFLHTHTLGLRQEPDSIAWESFVVAPVLGASLTWASGTFESPQGTIAASWRLDDAELEITVDVPPGSTARVVFPDGTERMAQPGRFSERRPM
ncbi:alpha-L-rhamnosidase [Agromyces albus]|uniref:alpha-L-rhamnosidase n=1 Tax=Agromyces albus TaxID=205332 RepID=A0A4Q2L7M1_9MICO|nr:alpha-L-rhamnosidase [Agromyces albus]